MLGSHVSTHLVTKVAHLPAWLELVDTLCSNHSAPKARESSNLSVGTLAPWLELAYALGLNPSARQGLVGSNPTGATQQ